MSVSSDRMHTRKDCQRDAFGLLIRQDIVPPFCNGQLPGTTFLLQAKLMVCSACIYNLFFKRSVKKAHKVPCTQNPPKSFFVVRQSMQKWRNDIAAIRESITQERYRLFRCAFSEVFADRHAGTDRLKFTFINFGMEAGAGGAENKKGSRPNRSGA